MNYQKNIFLTTKQKILLLLISNFVLLISALIIILLTPSASKFEFSIYDIYPSYFWYLVIFIFFYSFLISIYLLNNNIKDPFLKYCFVAILLTSVILFFMPLIRGYFTYGTGDPFTHIGYSLDILKFTSFGDDYYPFFHILLTDLFLFSNIPQTTIIMIIPPIFCLFWLLSWYLVSRLITKKGKYFILIIILCIITSATYIEYAPNSLGFLFLPFFFYIYLKHDLKANSTTCPNYDFFLSIFLIGFSIISVFFHPIIALSIISIILIYELSKKFYFSYILHEKSQLSTFPFILTLIIFIVFLIWQTYLYILTKSVNIFSQWIFENEGHSFVQEVQTYSSTYNIDIFTQVKYGIITYGVTGFFILLSFILIVYLIFQIKHQQSVLTHIDLQSILGFFIFLSLFILSFIVKLFGLGRLAALLSVFSLMIVISGYSIFITSNKNFYKNGCQIISIILIFCIISVGIFSTYPSPLTRQANRQGTHADFCGMNYFFNYRETSYSIQELGPTSSRYYDAQLGVSGKNKIWLGSKVPDSHFGYSNTTIRTDSSQERGRYLLINNLGVDFYKEIYPEFQKFWKFTPNDFNRLNVDNTINKIYYNGDLKIYYTY